MYERAVLKALLVQWLVTHNISFRVVESSSFRLLLMYLCSAKASVSEIHTLLPPKAHRTVRSYVLDVFNCKKRALRQRLQENAITNIHISFDLWTSPNHRAHLAVNAHWIEESCVDKHALLALPEMLGRHTGLNQADEIWEVLQDYELVRRLGWFTSDNASVNDVTMREIESRLSILEPPVAFNPVEWRIRCIGHTLNLVAKAFLYGRNPDAFEDALLCFNRPDQEAERTAYWRSKAGPLGKLRNLVTAINASPQRRRAFEEIARTHELTDNPLALISANQTRWGSDYQCCKRAREHRVAIDVFTARNSGALRADRNFDLSADQLTPEDWRDLGHIEDILLPLFRWTKVREGNGVNGSIFHTIPAMDQTLNAFEKAKEKYIVSGDVPGSEYIVAAINRAWDVLDKYVLTLARFRFTNTI